ncbi:MAG: Lrp/AsnC family transcriptional regulator [Phycisphaerales bacterium]|nr:Lrp/AsnC family transcriptional regulator [Phycisphaerales bacterium]
MSISAESVPVCTTDSINKRILAVSEDRIQGFLTDPLGEIAHQADLPVDLVIERIKAMLQAGTIRRVRQTLLATNLASGSLVAWQIPEDKLNSAFDWVFKDDPFTGHVVLRSSDAAIEGARFKLWTTLKVPQGYSIEAHCRLLAQRIGATAFRCMPAKRLFVLGVGHVRRRNLSAGAMADEPAIPQEPHIVELSELDWQVLVPLKREFEPDELVADLWSARAREAGVDLETFCRVAQSLNQRSVIGRFSTFLEHVKPVAGSQRLTRFNALFHWAVAPGYELEAGKQVGRFECMTHAYWREAGPEFNNVNIMGVTHSTEKQIVLDRKAAIDEYLAKIGIPVSYTNVFWGGRSEIKPSEISPQAYVNWCRSIGVDPQTLRG